MARTDEDLLATLTDVFRTRGYEGASLKILSDETGLARASLYHRFPGGKAQMDRALGWLDGQALAPLRDRSRTPRDRVLAMNRELDAFYESGRKSCLLDALSIGERGGPLHSRTRAALNLWLQELETTLSEAGVDQQEARRRAEQALVLIQGSLVVARVRDDPAPFRRVLGELPELLLGG